MPKKKYFFMLKIFGRIGQLKKGISIYWGLRLQTLDPIDGLKHCLPLWEKLKKSGI